MRSTWKRAAARGAWSAFGVALSSTLIAAIYFFTVTPLGSPPTFAQVLVWQMAVWSIWIPAAPLLYAFVERNAPPRDGSWQRWARLLLVFVAFATLHMLLFAIASEATSPYVTLQSFESAVLSYLAWYLLLDIAIYATLVTAALRAMGSLLPFRATQDGLLRTAGRAISDGSDGDDVLLEAMPGPVLVYDPDSLRLLAVNHNAIEQYGWTGPEFQQLSLFDIHRPEEAPSLLEKLERTRRLPLWRARSRHRRKDGSVFEVELINHAVNFGGRLARIVLVNDVTAVERAQAALAESERKFRSIIENAVVGVFQSTPEGRFLMINRSAAESIGYDTPEEVLADVQDIGQQLYVDPDERERYLEAILRDGSVSNWTWKMRRRDGSIKWNVENSRGVFDDLGQLLYVEGTAKDVTSEIAAREALAEAQLRALKLQLRPHFLFNILNTVAMMIRNGDTDKAQRIVTLLGDMFRGFLDFEGENTVSLAQELAFVDLYLSLEQYRFEDRMHIERDIDPALLAAQVPTLILQPIVENAVKHGVAGTAEPCRVSLAARRANGALVLTVTNDMGESTSTTHSKGHGIGLSNTEARLRELFGTRARFELVRAAGSATATLTLPMEDPQ